MFLAAGLSYILVAVREQNGFKGVNRYLMLMIYLTFMIFSVEVDIPVVISIALMTLAFFSVGLGFYLKQRPVRIYGLSLAILTCFKIALYDFSGVSNNNRIILFLVSGILALSISFIYIRLEKKEGQQE